MRSVAFTLALLAVPVLASAASPSVRAAEELAVPGYPAAVDIPGAHELPDPTLDYKIVWGIGQAGPDPAGKVNPALPTIARYVNTLAKWGVPKAKRHIIVMFHQRSADFDIVMSNDAFKARYGKDNPNVALISALTNAGVEFRACGQGVVGRKISPKDVNSDIQLDLWALTSFVNLQMKGFVRVGN